MYRANNRYISHHNPFVTITLEPWVMLGYDKSIDMIFGSSVRWCVPLQSMPIDSSDSRMKATEGRTPHEDSYSTNSAGNIDLDTTCYRYVCKQVNRQMNRHVNRQMNRHVNRQMNRHVNRQVNRHVNRQMNRQMNRQVRRGWPSKRGLAKSNGGCPSIWARK